MPTSAQQFRTTTNNVGLPFIPDWLDVRNDGAGGAIDHWLTLGGYGQIAGAWVSGAELTPSHLSASIRNAAKLYWLFYKMNAMEADILSTDPFTRLCGNGVSLAQTAPSYSQANMNLSTNLVPSRTYWSTNPDEPITTPIIRIFDGGKFVGFGLTRTRLTRGLFFDYDATAGAVEAFAELGSLFPETRLRNDANAVGNEISAWPRYNVFNEIPFLSVEWIKYAAFPEDFEQSTTTGEVKITTTNPNSVAWIQQLGFFDP